MAKPGPRTVGARVRQYIREQEKLESGQGDLNLKYRWHPPNEVSHLSRPQRGLHDVLGPLGRAFLKPRPMAVVDYRKAPSHPFSSQFFLAAHGSEREPCSDMTNRDTTVAPVCYANESVPTALNVVFSMLPNV